MLIQCMEWNMATRQSHILESELPELQQKAVDLLDMLQEHLPDKTGEKGKCNFEKAHSILHKVSEIVLWGNSDNTSCQAPEVCTWYILVHTWYILSTYLVCTFCQHAHIENIRWQTLPTTRMCSCASCVSMLGLDTSRHMRPSPRKSMSILALRL